MNVAIPNRVTPPTPLRIAVLTLSLLTMVPALAGEKQVLPPTATPHGWSLEDMAAAVANFSISGNDLAYYPDTPFQILYRLGDLQDPTGGNTFHVRPGTFFYIKFFFIDDAAPTLGDFPTDREEAAHYVFDPEQLGAHDLEVEVDGKVTPLGPEYVPAPVETPDSPDGSEHLVQIGAFLPPLPRGVHHVTIRGTFDGDLWDLVEPGFSLTAEIKYTIVVE